MATFTFGSGNVRKVAALPMYALGRLVGALAGIVLPRRTDRWVFGSAFGPTDGGWALLEEVRGRADAPHITWLAGSDAEAATARSLGLRTVRKDRVAGFLATLRAGTVVLTHGFGDANRYALDGARIVQLWHGSPLKRLHLDSPAALAVPVIGRLPGVSALVRRMYAAGSARIDLLPVSSALVAPRLASAFSLPTGRVRVLGEPRTDVLFTGSPSERTAAATARLAAAVGDLAGARVVLHAPTWRDGALDPTLPSAADWPAIDAWLGEHDAVLVVRPHPLAVGDWRPPSDRVRLLLPVDEPALNTVLWAADALVTDYSSVLVDFAVTGRPVVHLAPDAAAYAATRGFYEPMAALTDGPPAQTWPQVLDALGAVLRPGAEQDAARAHSAALAARFHHHADGRSAARVADALLGGSSTSPDALVPTGTRAAGASDPSEDTSGLTVFFESFYGRNCSDNPLALDAAIARRYRHLDRVWSVADPATCPPPGARAVTEGTEAWHTARSTARLLVLNDWIRDGFRPAPSQFVLQTWHGTPLKRIALSRRGRTPRQAAAVVKQSRRWSALLAQSPAAARVLRRAYAVTAPVWVEGYPRDDVLVTGDRAVARDRVGVTTPSSVLYAPTWREEDLAAEHLLDVSALAEALGPTWTVLVRGHARTMAERPQSQAAGVLDVTRHPDAAEVMAAADVLVTDWSSVMFDFSVTGRPMVFFVPDEGEYGRGTYWSLADRAPGPLVRTTAETAHAVATAQEQAPRWAVRYAAWRAEFNPLDDGHAADRVVDRLVAEGVLPPA